MPGLLRGMARTAVIAGTATAVSNRVSRRQANTWAAQDAAAVRRSSRPPAAAAGRAAPPPAESRVEKLKELAELKDQGVLTEEEFAAEKARILAS